MNIDLLRLSLIFCWKILGIQISLVEEESIELRLVLQQSSANIILVRKLLCYIYTVYLSGVTRHLN